MRQCQSQSIFLEFHADVVHDCIEEKNFSLLLVTSNQLLVLENKNVHNYVHTDVL
jgi:hypothetical protein